MYAVVGAVIYSQWVNGGRQFGSPGHHRVDTSDTPYRLREFAYVDPDGTALPFDWKAIL